MIEIYHSSPLDWLQQTGMLWYLMLDIGHIRAWF